MYLFIYLSFQIIGAALFATSIWFRVEPGFEDWVTKLELESYYIGIYLLMFVALVILGVSFLGCAAALTEVYLTLIIVSNLDAGNKRQPILQKSVCLLRRTTEVYSLRTIAK